MRKFIKVKQPTATEEEKQEKNELIIQNLRDFLTYLENKNIINPKRLSDEEEMNNLIKDIMKLDLNKFSKPRANSQGASR